MTIEFLRKQSRFALFLVVMPVFASPVREDVPAPWQREARAMFYAFGEGYVMANVKFVNPRAGKTPQRHRYKAKGIDVTWLSSADVLKPLPYHLNLSRPGHLLMDLTIGKSTAENIEAALGTPDSRGDGWLSYQGLAEICSDSFSFKLTAGVLSSVDWQWCSD